MNLLELKGSWNNRGPILITGHTGFKGTWLSLLLRRIGVETVGYSLRPEVGSMYETLGLEGEIPEKFEDIRDERALSDFLRNYKPSAVIHLAAQPLVINSYENPKETFDVNVIGTANLIQAVSKYPQIESILISTTDKVYENHNTGRRFRESDPLSGIDPYSASKVGTEAVIKAWQNIFKDQKKLISARAGNVIGGGDFSENRIIPDCVRAHKLKTKLEIRHPDSTRPWQHVLEPLSGYLTALTRGEDPAYNFGPNEEVNLSVREVVEVFQKSLEFNYAFLSNHDMPYESSQLSLDSSFAKERLGWCPVLSQESAVTKTAEWWKVALGNDSLLDFTNSQIDAYIDEQLTNV